jgi:hypothetical protein
MVLHLASTPSGERDRHNADLSSSFDVDQPVALYHHLCAYPPTLRFQQFRRGDVPATAIGERGNAASIYRAQGGVLRSHVVSLIDGLLASLIISAPGGCAFVRLSSSPLTPDRSP